MKYSIALLFALVGLASATLRLPLPHDVQMRYPALLTEPINPQADFVKVVGGIDAVTADGPWQIALLKSGSFSCGGSLIASNKVATAAHCVYNSESNPGAFTVRYGTLDRTKGTDARVSKITRHSSYSPSTIDYDVAVLTLSADYTPSSNAALVPLTSALPADGSNVQLTGWGRLSGGGALPTKLQKATLPIVSRTACQSAWGSTNSITPRMLCAHSKTQSACNGDSGGPLTQNGQLVGIVSWGSSSCLHATYPNVYANVANLRSWLLSA